jgi:hypothetical protein
MLDIVAAAIARCRLQVFSIFLTYLLSSGVGIVMVHSGSRFALGERDRIVGAATRSEPAALSRRSGHHLRAALQDFTANIFRAAVPQTLLGLAVFPPYISVAHQGWVGGIVSVDGQHRSRLTRPAAAAYYATVLMLQFVPFSLAIGAGVRAGLDLYAHNASAGWNLGNFRVPRTALRTLVGAYVLAIPLFLLASAVEFLWVQ